MATTLSLFSASQSQEVINLFTGVFSESESAAEGKIIGELVSNLITTTEPQDIIGCVALSDNQIVGAIFFSRLNVPSQETAFILSPVAISTRVQASGIGQKLINFGLSQLKSLKADLVFTYGDPNYYCKTGFSQISEEIVKAPFILSQPEGWLAQSLSAESIKAMQGATQCVGALSDQKYW